MADFSSLSDTDDSAVEDLISQARDLCVLEQVAAINCSGFVDSVLPNDLESRFSRLKSFPATTNPKPKPRPSSHVASSARFESDFASNNHSDDQDFSPPKLDPAKKMGSKPKSHSGYLSSSPLNSPGQRQKPHSKAESGSGSVSISSNPSSFSSDDFSPKSAKVSKRGLDKKKRFGSSTWSRRESPSPPRKPGCFWCSPKKGSSTRKSKEDWRESDDFGWSKNEELLADLGSFPIKEQRKILKQAMVEQKKISLEAQKIVKMAKQASSRLNVSAINDELSDD